MLPNARRYRVPLAAMAMLVMLVLAGCGSKPAAQPQQGSPPSATPAAPPVQQGPKSLRIALDSDPPQLDPSLSTAYVDRQVYASLYDKLVDIDKDLKIVPMLAETWEISDDAKTYTFHLRKNVLFHDGTPFNAAAVKFNWERDRDPKSPRASEISSISDIQVVDDYTIKAVLKQPYAPFLAALSDRAGMMVSPTAAAKAGPDFGLNPVGTGPFVFKERVKGDHITLTKNPKYWRTGFPKVDEVTYKTVTDENTRVLQLKSGALDIADRAPEKQVPTLRTDKSVVLDESSSLQFQGMYLNNTKPPFNDKAVRQAFSWAIDRKALVQVVFGDTALPADSPFPPGTPADDGVPIRARDVDKAKQLLGGKTVDVMLMIPSGSPQQVQIGEIIQNMAKDAGINVKLQPVEFGQILAAQKDKNYDATRVGWSGRPDPDGNIYNFIYTKAGNNDEGYSNPAADDLLNQSRIPSEMARRKAIYSQVLQIVRDDMPYMYLYFPKDFKLMQPAVKGYVHVLDGIIRTDAIDIQK